MPYSAPEASWVRALAPVSLFCFDLYHYLEQNWAFALVPEHATGPSSQVLPSSRVRHPLSSEKILVRPGLCTTDIEIVFHELGHWTICLYVYVYEYICISCVYIHTCIHKYIHMYIHVDLYIFVCEYTRVYIYIFIYMYIYTQCICIRID